MPTPLGITALAGAVALLGGVVGLLMMLVMIGLSRASWAIDDADSHGISDRQSSRLGGVALMLGATTFFATLHWSGPQWAPPLTDANRLMLPTYAWTVMLIALVGLCDDLAVKLSPAVRLFLVLSIAFWALISDPELLPVSVYAWVPQPFNQPAWLTFAGAVLVAGFVNAGNMADGANGLLASIALSFFGLAHWLTPTGYYWSAILSLAIFFVVNVATGRIFLGDFGSYSVSASVAFSGLALYATGGMSIWLLGALVAYPCIELVRVTVSRLLKRQSPLQAGDDHLHNRLFAYIRSKVENQTAANSLTGCTIGFVSSVLPSALAVTGVIEVSSSLVWLLYFAAYTALHVTAYYRLKTLNAGL
jgi:UDP-N-acetylmuramyl pentapeptide phosphotransferase/UDP-N-acetylglucosamine-1-phosphate transferase